MKETLEKLAALKQEIQKLGNTLQQEFRSELKQLFVDNPGLQRIEMTVGNHEFNDGSPTRFWIGYEEPTIIVDGKAYGVYAEDNYDDDELGGEEHPIIDAITTLFESVSYYHEDLFGDEYESMTIERSEILNK